MNLNKKIMKADEYIKAGKVELPENKKYANIIVDSIRKKLQYKYNKKFSVYQRDGYAHIEERTPFNSKHGHYYKTLVEKGRVVIPEDVQTACFYTYADKHGFKVRTQKYNGKFLIEVV